MIPDEGQAVERKQSLAEWREIVETCAAFATAQGGRVYVGAADAGQVVGVQIGKGTLEDLANKIAQNTNPRLVPRIVLERHADKEILCVHVSENRAKPVYAFDQAYRRAGRTNQRLSPTEAAELYFTSRGVTWDETIRSDATIQDIDGAKVRQFLERARYERRWEVSPDTPVDRVLGQLNLIDGGALTVAAVLLFGANPQQFLVQSSLRCARFKGDETVHFLDLKLIGGTLIDQVEEAMAFVKRHISMAAEIKDLEREEKWEYPLDAVREAITNAVCHRDYADSGNVQMRIFDHSLEVWNPGGLPAGLTVDDLRKTHESKPRNKLIARAFFLIRYIEQFGTGTGRMINDCRAAGLPDPQFDSRPGTFRIVFRKTIPVEERFAGLRLNERQLKALRYVLEKGRITRPEYEQVAQTTMRTAARDLADLVERRVLVRHGGGRDFWYALE